MALTKLCLNLFCFVNVLFLATGAPSLTERRTSRDLDKIDALRTRLHRLQEQIHQLEAEEGQAAAATGGGHADSDVSSQLHDVSRWQEGEEAQMTSHGQKQVQALAKELNEDKQKDLHELAETLNQLLRQTMSEKHGLGKSNSAGEYLSDRHNNMHNLGEQRPHKFDNKESEGDNKEEKGEEEEEGKEEGEESERQRLETIYNMLSNLYHQQQTAEERVVKSKIGYSGHVPDEETSSRDAAPGFHAQEGTFGDFVDTQEDSRPSAVLPTRQEMRKTVVAAVERKLLDDLHEAQDVGISVDDLIQDMQSKADRVKRQRLRQIENELDRLSEREG